MNTLKLLSPLEKVCLKFVTRLERMCLNFLNRFLGGEIKKKGNRKYLLLLKSFLYAF